MTGRMFVLSVVIAAVWCGGSLAATPPKAWQWTPSKAQTRLVAANPTMSVVAKGTIESAVCAGRTPAVAGRYWAFRCQVKWLEFGGPSTPRDLVVWVKLRKQGSGFMCVSAKSFADIDPACTTPR